MELGLKDKVAIITGGTQGIGRGIAQAFAAEGAKVAIAGRSEEKGTEVVASLTVQGAETLMVKTDVSNLEATDNLVKKVLERWGKVDILVHGAAAFSIQRFLDTPVEKWSEVINVSQYGAMNCARSVLPHMIERKQGRIIFIVSDAGRIGDPFQPIYAGAKGAIVAFGKSLAQDAGRYSITVNMVSPALTITEENRPILMRQYGLGDPEKEKRLVASYPLRKLGTTEDVAAMVVFLASEKANHITGQTISVNGGFCMV